MSRRWLFADQLGPHFLDAEDQPVLMIESRAAFRRRRFHRRKAHLVLSALRHRAAELGPQGVLVRAETYRDGLARHASRAGQGGRGGHPQGEELTVCAPTTRAARSLVDGLDEVTVLPSRGYAIGEQAFADWAGKRAGRLLMEDFYRDVRRHHRLLLTSDGEPEGGTWNYDHDNREPPPRGQARLDVPEPWWPEEDDIDAEVRQDLDRWEAEGVEFAGDDGPRRFAVTRAEALAALEHFVTTRLGTFGPYEDAILRGDRWMAHSLLSAPLNLGLLDPVEVAQRAERAYLDGTAPLASVEGFVRQVVGWRDYVWHMYWHLGEKHRRANGLDARTALPAWFTSLDRDQEVEARCLSSALADVREEGWTHHIPRLMVLGNWALQRGYRPQEMVSWFHENFVDGYDWVMVPNVVGMALHADGGTMMTKPYAAGGAYINRMSDHCRDCRYDPKVRVGEKACPFTAGYWAFMHDHRADFEANHRMRQAVRGLDRLKDLDALLEQERARGSSAP